MLFRNDKLCDIFQIWQTVPEFSVEPGNKATDS